MGDKHLNLSPKRPKVNFIFHQVKGKFHKNLQDSGTFSATLMDEFA